MKNNGSAVKTATGKTYFAANDALLSLYLSQDGSPTVAAVRMPSGAWSTNARLVARFN